jgi:peptidoglycan/LPS O-acetylase OafA/YrhL
VRIAGGILKKEVSLYLDAVRFIAAMVVFVSHFAFNRISGGLFWQMGAYSHEAVTVFFVLSGFVIAYVHDRRETAASEYCISRMARMYSVVIPALALTLILDGIGSTLRPDIYVNEAGYVLDISFVRILTGLTFTNELWTMSIPQGSNGVYWSMGYEVPYYAIFGIAVFTPARWRVAAVCAALLAVGPSIVLALPIWMSGVAAYRICKRDLLSARAGVAMFFGSLLAWTAYELVVWQIGRPDIAPTPWHKRTEILQDYVVASFFVLNIIGFNAATRELGRILLRLSRLIRFLAGASFSIYLCHFPILQFVSACMPWPRSDPRSRIVVFSVTIVTVLLLAFVTERKKDAWRKAIEWIWQGCSRNQRA